MPRSAPPRLVQANIDFVNRPYRRKRIACRAAATYRPRFLFRMWVRMKAVYYEAFGQVPVIAQVKDPTPSANGAVIKVEATGLCRSDWHGWMGHDPDIKLPHVPGHEFAGTIVARGQNVKAW